MADEVPALLPCPFCGGEAAYASRRVETSYSALDYTYITCVECGIRTLKYQGCTHENLADLWNTRVIPNEPEEGEMEMYERKDRTTS